MYGFGRLWLNAQYPVASLRKSEMFAGGSMPPNRRDPMIDEHVHGPMIFPCGACCGAAPILPRLPGTFLRLAAIESFNLKIRPIPKTRIRAGIRTDSVRLQ